VATILEYSKKRLQAFLEDISHLKGLGACPRIGSKKTLFSAEGSFLERIGM